MADLVTIATTAVLSQFLGPSAKHLGEQLLEQGKKVGAKAAALLAAVGREPQPVEPKVLLPLVQAAALETDESLADKWAALLANAADPAQAVSIGRGFVDVLQHLTPVDAVVLSLLYQRVQPDDPNALYYEMPAIATHGYAEQLGVTPKAFALSVDTLLRLRLCAQPKARRSDMNSDTFGGPSAASLRVCPTVFGREFLTACTPPTA